MGNCLCHWRFKNVQLGIRGNGRLIQFPLCTSQEPRRKLYTIMQHISMYRGRQWSTPVCTTQTSPYIIEDYKPVIFTDGRLPWAHTQGTDYSGCLMHTEERVPGGLVFLHSHRLPWKLFQSLESQKRILTLAWWVDSWPCLIPLIFCLLQQTHFCILCILYFLTS